MNESHEQLFTSTSWCVPWISRSGECRWNLPPNRQNRILLIGYQFWGIYYTTSQTNSKVSPRGTTLRQTVLTFF